MKTARTNALGLLLLSLFCLQLSSPAWAKCPELLDHQMRKLRSTESLSLCETYAGKTLLIVNTASHCGFTPQFRGLETLYQAYKDRGLVVAGFPSNSFRQEASDEEVTAEICYVNYGVTFDMFAQVEVTGRDAHPLFAQLARAHGEPRWNFTKYLINSRGEAVARFGSKTTPDDPALIQAIEEQLAPVLK